MSTFQLNNKNNNNVYTITYMSGEEIEVKTYSLKRAIEIAEKYKKEFRSEYKIKGETNV